MKNKTKQSLIKIKNNLISNQKIYLIGLVLVFAVFSGKIEDESNLSLRNWFARSYKMIDQQIKYYGQSKSFVGVAVKDLTTGEYFSINGDEQFNPASVIKVAVMAAAFDQKQKGLLSFDEFLKLNDNNKTWGSGILQYYRTGTSLKVKELINLMITISDNTATNMLMERLGMDYINDFLQANRATKTSVVDKTLLCKIPGKYNLSTPNDMLCLLEQIYKGKLISKEASDDMISIMEKQKSKWGIPRYLPSKLTVANKTGSLLGIRNDVGLVYGDDGDYAVVIFTRNMPSNYHAASLVSSLSRVIYSSKL